MMGSRRRATAPGCSLLTDRPTTDDGHFALETRHPRALLPLDVIASSGASANPVDWEDGSIE
jgi:hypothetical protein